MFSVVVHDVNKIIYLSGVCLQAEIARQEARLKIERENLEKEKSVLMGTASSQDNQESRNIFLCAIANCI